MRLCIEIDIDNADFLEAGALAAALQPIIEAAEEVCGAHPGTLIVDRNGNAVGSWSIQS
jgi:hypothetical protein